MTVRLALALITAAAIGAAGAFLAGRAIHRTYDVERGGLPVVCTSLDARCWQGGRRVHAPHVGDACGTVANANFQWARVSDQGGPLFDTFACEGSE